MDGSPSDVLSLNADGGPHTIVMVFGQNQSIDLQQEEALQPFFPRFGLQKAVNPNDQALYRRRVMDVLADRETHRRLQVFAVTYDEATAMAAKDALLTRCYGEDGHRQFYSEFRAEQNRRLMAAFPSAFIKGKVISGKLNAILPMFIIAEFVASVHEQMEAMYNELRQPYAGLLVLSDKLCGDGEGGSPKATIVNGLLQSWYSDRMRVRSYSHPPKRCGEFLADNISGLLNACARDPSYPGWETARAMRRGRALSWQAMDSKGRFLPEMRAG